MNVWRQAANMTDSERGAIYLLEKFKGKKIGAALLKLGMKQLLEWKDLHSFAR
jgi:hypothetical protein